jgi:hypothetical protein
MKKELKEIKRRKKLRAWKRDFLKVNHGMIYIHYEHCNAR